ncbi:AraC family transcriptional regulator [Allomuricauda sp. NBRC 101325]|uniref:AraC family transcriptional regulator n=1 Tax=Allomuricauda sp. NBRC 101325 TaxID=1113758 RepID=UPI0024A39D70|nr:AraC family transcriptional regulator [Muricauda sp. NBRC 101325]GLU42877.1 AraC family transcriptional regulator [Muricauda sp. NBRC 101325]
MKVLPFKIPKPSDEALVYQIDHERIFYDHLHQHEEIQISYIAKGSGSLVVADSISDYQEGDVLVIGGFVPHAFKSDASASSKSIMHTLFFDINSFGKDFFGITDLASTKEFFKKSEMGIRVVSNKEVIIEAFRKLKSQNKVEQIATLLLVISEIMKAQTQPLSSFVYRKTFSDDEGKRMNDVFKHAMEKFNEPIELDEIAQVANMSKNAFCRYFKRRTNKTFFQFLIEIRIENACKLILSQPELAISAVSDQCGFNNIANFNRKFKELKGCSPTQFRSKF